MAKKKVSRREETPAFPIKRLALCSLIGSGLYFVMIFAFAFTELRVGLGVKYYMPLGIIYAALSAFLSGFASLYSIKEKAFQYGSLTGLMQAFVCTVILFIINGVTGGTGIFVQFLVMALSSVLGAVVSANMKVKNKY